ncbi:unnamed protein product, partial [Brassica oleracea]
IVPDEFRCNCSDGKQCGCKRRALEGKKMSETHTSQLSQKRKATESTKRLLSSKIKPNEGGIRARGLGKPKQRLMLMKIGDLQLDLVRMLCNLLRCSVSVREVLQEVVQMCIMKMELNGSSSDSEDEEEEEEEIEKEGEKEGGRKKKKNFLDEEADEVPIAGEADTYEFDPVQGSFTANNTFAKNLNSLVSSLSSLTPKFMASTASLPETHLENQLTQLPFVEEKSKDMIVSDVFRQLQETSPSCIQGRKRILCGTHTVATDTFSQENELGRGGFGSVYKGMFSDGQEIAVKRLSNTSGEGDIEIKNEIILLAKLRHRNLARLLGFCIKGEERLLVYEFIKNASLDRFIFADLEKRQLLDWGMRYKMIEGVHRCQRIIHRDLKASKILLDQEMNPKIADFGLAKVFEIGQTM